MNAPLCSPVAEAAHYKRKAVRSLRYEGGAVIVEIEGSDLSRARVTFANVVGFRVLDERELTEFWDAYSEQNGWLYRVERGGWLELEQHRRSFVAAELSPELREYLLVDDMCVSVLMETAPVIIDLGRTDGAG